MKARTKVFWRQLRKGKWKMPLLILNNIAKGIILWRCCRRCGSKKRLTVLLCAYCAHDNLMEFLQEKDV